jgi:hypothetical protein
VTRLSLSTEKRSNDGDYGSEKVELEVSADIEAAENWMAVGDQLLAELRRMVMTDLARSPNLKVRQSTVRRARTCSHCHQELADAETGYMHEACEDLAHQEAEARRKERDREWEAQRAEQQAEYQRERELAGVRGSSDEDDDEDVPL